MNQQNAKPHYKMYKSGKLWLFSMSLIAGVTGAITGGQVSAATSDPAQETATVEKAVTMQPAVTQTLKVASTKAAVTKPDTTTVAENQPTLADTTNQAPASAQTPVKASQAATRLLRSQAPAQPAVTTKAVAPQADESINDWMPNVKLQNLVLLMLQQQDKTKTYSSVNDITQADMAKLTYVDNYWKIPFGLGSPEFIKYETYNDGVTPYSLEGLQYATNLKDLVLRQNLNGGHGAFQGDITDITPIKNLTNLEYIELSGNRISDVTPLANLKKVTYLNIVWNSIVDFSPLNPAQYTGDHTYPTGPSTGDVTGQIDPAVTSNGVLNQRVVLPPVYIDPSTTLPYTYNLASMIKLPGGLTGKLVANNTGRIGGRVTMEPTTGNKQSIKVWDNAGTSVSDGGTGLIYTITHDQVEKPNLAGSYPQYTVVPQDYEYYMVATYFASGQTSNPVATVFIPYVFGHEPTLTGEDVTIYVNDPKPDGSAFNPKATDVNGKDEPVTVSGLEIADNTKVGDYPITLTTTDGQSKTVYLHVVASKASLTGSDYTMYVGDPTPGATEFNATATDKAGNPVSVTVDLSQADLTTPGDYPVTLTTTDGQKKTVTLHVKARETSPGNPGNPSEPGNPGNPSEPGNPSLPGTGGNGNEGNNGNGGQQPSKPSNPSQPGQPSLPGTVTRPTPGTNQSMPAHTQTALPQTSDRKQSGLAIAGILASVLGAFGLWFTFKKH